MNLEAPSELRVPGSGPFPWKAMAMKVLSIKQPWAWAIIEGWKDVENRTWRTHYRGPLAIHASLEPDHDAWSALDRLGVPHPFADELVAGAVVGVADLVDVIEDAPSPWARAGQWHWLLANRRPLSVPLQRRGHVGLVEASADVIAHVERTALSE